MVIIQLLISGAAAQPELPVPVAARPATLPRATARLDADSTVGLAPDTETGVDLTAGFGVGVTDDLEIGAELFPIQFTPEVTYESPLLYAAYGFDPAEGVQIIPMARVSVPIGPDTNPLLDVVGEVNLNPTRLLRVSFLPSANLSFGEGPVKPSFAAPVSLTLQPDRRFFVGLESGVATDPVDPRYRVPRPGEVDGALIIPVGATIGTTVGRPRAAMADLSAGVYWPQMGQFAGQSQANPEDFTVLARVQTFIPGEPPSVRGNRPTGRR